jgi:hypothetical protein
MPPTNRLSNDTEEDFAWGEVLEVEQQSPAWARVRLDDGRCLTAVAPELGGRRDGSLPGGLVPGERVCVLLGEGYGLITRIQHLSRPNPPRGSEPPGSVI